MSLRALAVLAGVLAVGAAAASAPATTGIPIATVVEVGGRPLTIDGTLTLAPAPRPGEGTRVHALIDLGSVVAALHSALERRLPRDRCRRHALDNWVAQLRHYSAQVDDDRLLLEVALDVELWACLEWHGNEVRRRVSRGRAWMRLPLELDAGDAGLRLRAGRPQVDVRGPLGDAARAYLALRGLEVGDLLADRVAQLNARQPAFPVPALWLHQGTLRSARFVDAGRPSMAIEAELRPALPGWAQRLLGRQP